MAAKDTFRVQVPKEKPVVNHIGSLVFSVVHMINFVGATSASVSSLQKCETLPQF